MRYSSLIEFVFYRSLGCLRKKNYFRKVGSVTLCLLISLHEKISVVGFVLPVASVQFPKFQQQQPWRMYSRILCSCTIDR